MSENVHTAITRALWRIYNRSERPLPWEGTGNLPWNDAAFSGRMLREHLDDSHGAASRQSAERERLVEWLWHNLRLDEGKAVLDLTCGPGLYTVALAKRGCTVTGIDFGPASIAYARSHALSSGVAHLCTYIEEDVRAVTLPENTFDAALFLYGQLAVFTIDEARNLLAKIFSALRPGARLCVELLNEERIDKKDSTWWFTDDKGLWGDAPFLHLGERFWLDEEKLSVERFNILQLDSGEHEEITLCDQAYSPAEMVEMMQDAGFSRVQLFDDLSRLILYDADEWIIYLAEKE